jgi:hypothetical protein
MEQFFQPDRQLADPEAGCVVDGIGDRRVGADIAELAQILDAKIVDQVILLGDQEMAAHESARTTKLYDRRSDKITLDEVERIPVLDRRERLVFSDCGRQADMVASETKPRP